MINILNKAKIRRDYSFVMHTIACVCCMCIACVLQGMFVCLFVCLFRSPLAFAKQQLFFLGSIINVTNNIEIHR